MIPPETEQNFPETVPVRFWVLDLTGQFFPSGPGLRFGARPLGRSHRGRCLESPPVRRQRYHDHAD